MSTKKPLKVTGLIQAGVMQDSNEDRVFGAASGKPLHAGSGPVQIPLSLVDDSPYQPRIVYDPAEIDNLAHSLAAAGIEDPIMVRVKDGGRYELISGHRRVRAARSLGWSEIQANVVEKDDRQAELATMVQNEARVDLTDYERGKLYQAAIASAFGQTQTEVANLFGTSQGRVSACMAMLKLPPNIISLLEDRPDLFSRSCGEAISKLMKAYPDELTLIEEAVLRIKEEGADQKSVTQWVHQMVKQKRGAAISKPRAIVTDEAGREMFVVKRTEREVAIQLKAPEISAAEVENVILAVLRKMQTEVQDKLSKLDNSEDGMKD